MALREHTGGSHHAEPGREGGDPNTTPEATTPQPRTRNGEFNTANHEPSRRGFSIDDFFNPLGARQEAPAPTQEEAERFNRHTGAHRKPESWLRRNRPVAAVTAFGLAGLTAAGIFIGTRIMGGDNADRDAQHNAIPPVATAPHTPGEVEGNGGQAPETTEPTVGVEAYPEVGTQPSEEKLSLLENLREQRENFGIFTDEDADPFEVLNETFVKRLDLAVSLAYDPQYANDRDALEEELHRLFTVGNPDGDLGDAEYWEKWVRDQWDKDAGTYPDLANSDIVRRVAVNPDDLGESTDLNIYDTRNAVGVELRTYGVHFPEGRRTIVDGRIDVTHLPDVYMKIHSKLEDDNIVEYWDVETYGNSFGQDLVTEPVYVNETEDPVRAAVPQG